MDSKRCRPEPLLGDEPSDLRFLGGPKGIRTPDLLPASQNGLNAVLTCGNAGQERAERPLLFAVAKSIQ